MVSWSVARCSSYDNNTHCQGRLVRWGETKMEEPRRGLYLLWEMSSSTFSMAIGRNDILEEREEVRKRKEKSPKIVGKGQGWTSGGNAGSPE
jgi:hypothetical protein